MSPPAEGRPWIAARGAHSAGGEFLWIAGAALVGFLVSFLSADLLRLPRAGFVIVHLVASGALVWSYARWSGATPRDLIGRPARGVAAGLIAASAMAAFVLRQPASPAPEGWTLAWELIWLGVAYGSIDALLLTVLPTFAAWRILRRVPGRSRWGAPLAAAGLALAASAFVTAAYHMGFPEFRGAALVAPLIGNTVMTLAYLCGGSALAPLLAHVGLHSAAVVHAYATSIPLPPHY